MQREHVRLSDKGTDPTVVGEHEFHNTKLSKLVDVTVFTKGTIREYLDVEFTVGLGLHVRGEFACPNGHRVAFGFRGRHTYIPCLVAGGSCFLAALGKQRRGGHQQSYDERQKDNTICHMNLLKNVLMRIENFSHVV